jgi:hypothetical protein
MKVSRQLATNGQNAPATKPKCFSEFSVISGKTIFATKAIHNAVEAIAIPLPRMHEVDRSHSADKIPDFRQPS